MSRRPHLGLLLVVVTLAAACGEIEEPEPFAIGPTTTAAEPAAEASETDEPATAVQSDSPATTEFVPTRSEDYVPEVLISTDLEVLAASQSEVRPLVGSFAGLATDRAVDDLVGGLVVQEDIDEDTGTGDVVWHRAEGGEPMVIDRAGAELLDVGYVGGSPSAVVLVGDDQIDRIRLVDNERTSMLTLDGEERVLDLSASGGFHAVVVANDLCGELRFYTADGSRIDLNGPGEPNCIVPRRPAYGAVGLSPDVGAVAYTEVRYRDDGIEVATDLVARELPSGTEFYRDRIGEDGDRVTALSFDGERVAYLRLSETEVAVVLVDLTTRSETVIALEEDVVVDSVSFARLPLAGS